MAKKKLLIAYYSRAGQNYADGGIVDLAVGNTAVVAGKIKQLTGADLFQIKTIITYPIDYHETTEVAKKELRDNARPELTDAVANLADYELIILGYPNWWGTMPMAVYTFLESGDFSGKTILPLCTHEGSGMGRSAKEIKKLCPNAKVSDGLAIVGSSVHNADKAIGQWLMKEGVVTK